MHQLSLSNFPKPGASSVTIDKVFERMGQVFEPVHLPSDTKLIRLAKDLAKQAGPLKLDHHDHVRAILGYDVSDEEIDMTPSHKETLFKTVITNITFHNGRYKITTKKVRRK
jgi:hypothetical protein